MELVLKTRGYNLEDDGDLPSETEASEEANTRALFAPLWRFLDLSQNLRFLRSLLISTRSTAFSRRWLHSPMIPNFNRQTFDTNKSFRQEIAGKKHMNVFKQMKSTANAR